MPSIERSGVQEAKVRCEALIAQICSLEAEGQYGSRGWHQLQEELYVALREMRRRGATPADMYRVGAEEVE